jgi:hypothetical protein
MAQCPGVIYLAVSKDGSASVNGENVNSAHLSVKMKELRSAAREIWYYREHANAEPTEKEWASIRTVLDAMMSTGLPISFSSRADFSDYVDGQGNSHPRPSCENTN